jgi:hypothetical protein
VRTNETTRSAGWSPPSWTEPLEPTLVTSDPRDVVRFLHDVIEMTDADIAEAIGLQAEVTVRRWRSEDASSAPRRTDRVDNLRAIVGMLVNSRLLYPEEVGRFMRSRNEHLDYERPMTLLGQGEFARVREAAEELLSQLASRRSWVDSDDGSTPSPGNTTQLPHGMTRVEAPVTEECQPPCVRE